MRSGLTLADILAARERIAGGIYASPCVESIPLSQLTGAHIYCKLDYLQRTGSFKERGARNALALLSSEQRKQGVIAASAGNHALGVAYHGGLLGIPVTVVMPRFAAMDSAGTTPGGGMMPSISDVSTGLHPAAGSSSSRILGSVASARASSRRLSAP